MRRVTAEAVKVVEVRIVGPQIGVTAARSADEPHERASREMDGGGALDEHGKLGPDRKLEAHANVSATSDASAFGEIGYFTR